MDAVHFSSLPETNGMAWYDNDFPLAQGPSNSDHKPRLGDTIALLVTTRNC